MKAMFALTAIAKGEVMNAKMLLMFLGDGSRPEPVAQDERPEDALAVHDKRFHPNGFHEGDTCELRRQGDKADSTLSEKQGDDIPDFCDDETLVRNVTKELVDEYPQLNATHDLDVCKFSDTDFRAAIEWHVFDGEQNKKDKRFDSFSPRKIKKLLKLHGCDMTSYQTHTNVDDATWDLDRFIFVRFERDEEHDPEKIRRRQEERQEKEKLRRGISEAVQAYYRERQLEKEKDERIAQAISKLFDTIEKQSDADGGES